MRSARDTLSDLIIEHDGGDREALVLARAAIAFFEDQDFIAGELPPEADYGSEHELLLMDGTRLMARYLSEMRWLGVYRIYDWHASKAVSIGEVVAWRVKP